MKSDGTKFLHECVPLAVKKDAKSGLIVKWQRKNGRQSEDSFDTVLFAIGNLLYLIHYFKTF